MTSEQFQNETAYQLTMYHAEDLRQLRKQGLITKDEYNAFDVMMTEKYKPVFVDFMRVLDVD